MEGGDFRFEEIRSLAYFLSHKKLSIARPLRLLTNFRSHSGILNCASAVLNKMFAMFPHAAKVLPVDKGLFKGPRPNFLLCSNGIKDAAAVLARNARLVVLCLDEKVDDINSELTAEGCANFFLLGCRDAKGLEFNDVMLLDFFSSIPMADQPSWKHLFQRDDFREQYKFPQLESQLKLLYTAITRCSSRLLFVETKKSLAGHAFYRWLERNQLAERISTSGGNLIFSDGDVSSVMSKDEWRARGLDFVMTVDTEGLLTSDFSYSEQMFERAYRCFQMAEDQRLKSRTRLHLQIIQTIHKLNSMTTTALASNASSIPVLDIRDELAVANVILRCLQQKHQLEEVVLLCEYLAPMSCEEKLFTTDVYNSIRNLKRLR